MSAKTVNTIIADQRLRDEVEAIFWSKVKKLGPDDCWIYQRPRTPNADTHVRLTIKQNLFSAHVMAWALENGPVPSGLIVRHACDNPPCCNPAHLLIGTYSDNVQDMLKRNRMKPFSEPELNRRSQALKRRWQDPEWRAKMRQAVSGERHYLFKKGMKQTPDIIAKRVASRKGYVPSESTRQKLSEANRGKAVSQETRRKIGEAKRGTRHSAATKEKMRRSALERIARKREPKI